MPPPSHAGMEKQEPSIEPDKQVECFLFQRVPQEIRNHVYAQLFSSTRFTFGARWTSCLSRGFVKPAPHGLALLRTCWRARLEIGDSWLRHVLFSFEDPYTMLDKLSTLPIETLSKIRHLRVSGEQLEYTIWEEVEAYPLAGALKLLPGLRLDQLTVIGVAEGPANYNTLSGLIEGSGGWKTLRFVSPNSAMLGFQAGWSIPSPLGDLLNHWETWRVSQPENWQAALEARDGPGSHPSVTVHRATEPGHRGSIPHPSECVEHRQKPVQQLPGWHTTFVPEDPDLVGKGEKDKELLVVVKRGAGIDYQEREDSPFIEGDFRKRPNASAWYDIEDSALWADGQMPRGPRPPIVDEYNDAEDHVWTQRHLREVIVRRPLQLGSRQVPT
ncbi:hypothetical protein B0I37DRAFT_380586 [Chaetomium sp. MPI-CAGE-AT-0009]|nr:hypothetical protein B0I37DRAFT_380586 [Chaetomium sp. MPI-CAGE-AT-0009]